MNTKPRTRTQVYRAIVLRWFQLEEHARNQYTDPTFLCLYGPSVERISADIRRLYYVNNQASDEDVYSTVLKNMNNEIVIIERELQRREDEEEKREKAKQRKEKETSEIFEMDDIVIHPGTKLEKSGSTGSAERIKKAHSELTYSTFTSSQRKAS